MAFPSGKVSIVGVYLTEQGKLPHRTPESLWLEAFSGALEDAGLEPKDVDGIACSARNPGWWTHQLDQPITWVGDYVMGASSVAEAAAYINAGLCNVVAVVHGQSGRRIGPSGQSTEVTSAAPRTTEWAGTPWGMFMSVYYAQMAQRHMYEFGTTSEQLAQVAITMRKHATLNPRSIMGNRGEITTEDVLNSRMIASPLHLLDCCLDNDGGYAFIVTSAERARDLKKRPVDVLGGALTLWSASYDEYTDNYYPSPASITGPKAMAQAGVTHDDLDVLGLYDCFTITVVRLLEDLGFCKLGEGGAFVEGGTLQLGGKFPTNTHGGLLSMSHNGLPGGMHVIEVVQQLRGEVEPERQVPNAKIGLVHHQGAAVLGRHSTCILAAN